ncbi:DUF262 domain-containing protein [Mesorhizobium sp. BR1-1-15]|uniref:DUF262 domain-containing protein n=1 Tax=Mesorhizobium sp. BR1-1-15 TaxID=2876654 RepID=UPI001CC9C26F|nr:DUF262 domain-containing protein [Mesorhizobium sp. BR1-1-15]MBZ9953060.1 DUF262 domain-containing protein [Mesorhizobium sp. BR1-1-15]
MAEYDGITEEPEPLAVGKSVVPAGTSDKQIEKHFETGRLRVVQEKNDIFLSHVMTFISGTGNLWSNLQPEYQRRLRWDNKKKSRLIESFIMNVPVPPVFLYEKELGRFEVMDGQQRLNAISDFLAGGFVLEGLAIWPALNGRNYSTLPPLVRRGLDRAKISAITLMSDNNSAAEDSLDLRAQVFERLNTGGERLNQQELRNSLYSGDFNALLIELSRTRVFTDAWEIPNHEDNTRADGTPSAVLAANTLFKRMTDVEIVLRFFAFREADKLSGSVRSMLDGTMKRLRRPDEVTLQALRQDFMDAIGLCTEVFGPHTFRLPPVDNKPGKISRPLYDAEMVAIFNLRARRNDLLSNRQIIRDRILDMAAPDADTYDLMVGRGNTAAAIAGRIAAVRELLQEIINA